MRPRIESKILTLSLGLFIFWMGTENPCFGTLTDNRVYIERILQATNLKFGKESRPAAFVFQFSEGDSLRIECADCQTRMRNVDGKGAVSLTLASSLEKRLLTAEMLGKWLPVVSENGKLGLLFERNGSGERLLTIGAITLTRKSRVASVDVPGKSTGLLEVNNFYLAGHDMALEGKSSTFFFKLRSDDQVKLDLVGIDRSAIDGVGCYLFRMGEEYAKKPIKVGSAMTTSGGNSNHDLYGIEITHNKDVKQGQHYHLSVAKISASNPSTSSTKGK